MEELTLMGKCGMLCNECEDFLVDKWCHGCNCECNECAAIAHNKLCRVSNCVFERGYPDCSACGDFPCTTLKNLAMKKMEEQEQDIIYNLESRQKA